MTAHTAVPFVDTTIIPDRNAGIGSLLWDLQHPPDPDRAGPPLLDPRFAFIDVGVSRATASAALKSLLAGDLGMDVAYVATELPEVVPIASVTLLGARAERIRASLSAMISSNETAREVTDWHYVVDRGGKVSSVAYSYRHHGNEVWEAYFMGRPFMVSGERVEFRDPALEELLAPDVARIEARITRERNPDGAPSRPALSWVGYRVERDPLERGLEEFGISLQATDVPRRIEGRQNVLFLGNVLNHYPQEERARELDRVAAGMQEGDLVIVQVDEVETSFIEVLRVRGQGPQKSLERARWIETRTLEVQMRVPGSGAWRRVQVRPALERVAARLVDRLGRRASAPEGNRGAHEGLLRRQVSQVLGSHFRALPVEETLRVAVREIWRRLASEHRPEGIPAFMADSQDTLGDALGLGLSPIVSGADDDA